jgi:hypothetical protein
MRRVGILVGLLATAAAFAVYFADRGHSGSETKRAAPRITLLAQAQGRYGAWKTTRHISVACRAQPSVRRPGGSLCEAIRYYARHLPTRPCLVHGVTVTRVVISGRVGGRSTKLRIGPVCNPPPGLAHAVQAIYRAAFKPATPSKLQTSA